MIARRFLSYCLIVAQALLPAGCSRDTTYHGAARPGGLAAAVASSFNLGEKVFLLVRSRLAASPTGATAKVAAFDARRGEFIAAVNVVVTPQSAAGIGSALRAFFALVDDGTLPAMAANVAEVLESVANEPAQRTLRALVALSDTRSVLQTDDLLQYVARSVNYRELEQVMAAIAELVRANDGVDDQGRPSAERDIVRDVQRLAAEMLREYAAPLPGTTGPGTTSAAQGLLTGLSDELLVDAPPRPSARVQLGAPAWVVRVDRHGNPAVAADAQGKLLAPFTDRDADGAADVNATGDPIDASGAPIDIAPFGIAGAPGRDADGRALAPGAGGALLYRYADAKETLLSHYLQLGGEGLRRRIDELGFDVGEIALGPRVLRDNGTPADPTDDYLGFAATNPVLDLAWGGLEIAKYPGTPKLLRAIASLERTDPALAERVLVMVGKVCEKLRPIVHGPASGAPGAGRATTDRLLLLGDRVFDTRAGTSVGRALFDVVDRIGHAARELPHELALMARYKRLALDAAGNPLPAPQSLLVDFGLPPTKAGSAQGENRSALHQLLDLLAAADKCKTFVWAGKPLSETIIELMAGRSAGTAATLIGFLQNPLVRTIATFACPGISTDLDALQALAASGALDGFLPIAKAFVDRGETRLLVDILDAVQADYAATVRPDEPTLADVLDSGAFGPIFDLDALLVSGRNGQAVRDPVSGERAIDLAADSLAWLLDHPATGVATRLNGRVPGRAHLALEPLRRVEDAASAAPGGSALVTSLFYAASDLLIERALNDGGTPFDPGDDFEELVNASVAPFTGRVLDCIARNLPQDAAARAARIRDAQASAVAAIDGRHFATTFDLGKVLRTASASSAIRDALAHTLTPDPIAADDVFGSLLKLVTFVLQTRVDQAPLRDLAAFAGDLFDPATGRAVALVTGAARVLVADRGRTCITLIRNALNDAPAGSGLAPGTSAADALLSVLNDVRRAGGSGSGTTTDRVAELQVAAQAAAAYIRDDREGLGRIFALIRGRPR